MKQNHLGIDHPLIAVKDMAETAKAFARLGFYINPRHHHPWGTDNHLLMFADNFIELISIYDDTKLDLTNEQGFAFGRFIDNAIQRREGLALVALHSEDARQDHQLMEQRGVENHGIVDFKRVAHRPDGSEEEAIVSLVMLINAKYPSVSQFLCHQHKPELVWVDEWMQHPNGAKGISRVSYVANELQVAELSARFKKIYGDKAITISKAQVSVQTDCGMFELLTPSQAVARFEGVEIPLNDHHLPCGVGIRLSTHSTDLAKSHLDKQQVDYIETAQGGLRIPAHYAGNTIIEIYPDQYGETKPCKPL